MIRPTRWFAGKSIRFDRNISRDVFFLYRLDDLNSKYRFMEMNLLQKKKRLRGKLPDIQICLGQFDDFLAIFQSVFIFIFILKIWSNNWENIVKMVRIWTRIFFLLIISTVKQRFRQRTR